jgi:hypothetical protein
MPAPKYNNRSWTLYFPSDEDMTRWKEYAKKAALPLSHWIYETVEAHLAEDSSLRLDLIRETDQSREELAKLRRDLKDKSATIEKMETELFRLRHQTLLQPITNDSNQFGEELITLLKTGRNWHGSELLKALGIDPRNSDAMTIILRQLQTLQDLKLVQEGTKGWRWVG